MVERDSEERTSMNEHTVEPGSDIDLAIERALAAANLRAGGATEAHQPVAVAEDELSAAEAGTIDGADGD